ncbi:ABC transporter permease subunit [Crassaminicella thermophila]|uniref:ABC transporter permease subunit n=1 Tax=Crassaminicella thermophila TaxID=2599308 RepID=A0A5C0SGY4_CRATE|nr:ABC transporter permease subunit [Crassaminicella thermophila]QEK12986.1 ABC transporter permease subunit [Crassaminicella thermophila]
MKRKNSLIFKTIMYILIFMLVFPLLVLVIWSFSKSWPWPYLIPKDFGLRGFCYITSATCKSPRILVYSIFLSMIVTIINLLISIPAAKALGVYTFRGKKFFKTLILAPIIVPPVAVAMGIHVSFIKIGLANTFWGVVLVHLVPTIPYGVRILMNVFEIVGDSMEMQARVLGAKPIQIFFYVTLPLIAPGLVSAASMVFIISFSQYFLTFLIGGGKVVTFVIDMFPYIQSGDRMMASIYSLIFIITSFMVLLIMEKSVKAYYKTEAHFYL